MIEITEDRSISKFARLTISLPGQLLDQLDAMQVKRGLATRSQMVAELIGRELAEHEVRQSDPLLAGAITLIYTAESGRVRNALAQTQLAYLKEVISSQHVFLEEDKSLEVLLVQGPAVRLRQLCDDLRRIRSVLQIKLVTTTWLLPPLNAQAAENVLARAQSAAPARRITNVDGQ